MQLGVANDDIAKDSSSLIRKRVSVTHSINLLNQQLQLIACLFERLAPRAISLDPIADAHALLVDVNDYAVSWGSADLNNALKIRSCFVLVGDASELQTKRFLVCCSMPVN